jgi:DNA-binding Xre family transcriptional regulator
MDMRLRIPELFEEKGITPYRVSRDSGARISLATIYRLKRTRGRLDTYKSRMLDALCDVLDVTPAELFERDKPAKRR